MKEVSHKSILVLQVISFIYVLFLIMYPAIYGIIPEMLNTLIGVVTNLLTLPIVLLVVPFGLIYAAYQLFIKKNKHKMIWFTLIISTISIGTMILATVLEK